MLLYVFEWTYSEKFLKKLRTKIQLQKISGIFCEKYLHGNYWR